MVYKLLSFFFSKCTVLQISLNIDIKEGRNTSNTHCCTVLSFDCCQISEIQPLESFSCILCRLGNVIAVSFCHNLHTLQCTDLVCNFFTKLEIIASHTLTVAGCKIFFLSFDQSINSIQSHTSVIAYNTSTSVSIRKTCQDLVMTCKLHLWCVDIKYSLIVSLEFIVIENIFDLVTYVIAIGFACLFCHFNSAVWHKSTFQRFVCLKTNNLLQILCLLINISRSVSSQRSNNLCLHIQDTALCTLLFLKCLQLIPELIGSFCRFFKEGSISFIWSVVHTDKVTNINFLLPTVALKAIPLFKISHHLTSFF